MKHLKNSGADIVSVREAAGKTAQWRKGQKRLKQHYPETADNLPPPARAARAVPPDATRPGKMNITHTQLYFRAPPQLLPLPDAGQGEIYA